MKSKIGVHSFRRGGATSAANNAVLNRLFKVVWETWQYLEGWKNSKILLQTQFWKFKTFFPEVHF